MTERLKAAEVAEMLGISETKVRDLARRTKDPMPCRNYADCIRFVRSEVIEWDRRQSNVA